MLRTYLKWDQNGQHLEAFFIQITWKIQWRKTCCIRAAWLLSSGYFIGNGPSAISNWPTGDNVSFHSSMLTIHKRKKYNPCERRGVQRSQMVQGFAIFVYLWHCILQAHGQIRHIAKRALTYPTLVMKDICTPNNSTVLEQARKV